MNISLENLTSAHAHGILVSLGRTAGESPSNVSMENLASFALALLAVAQRRLLEALAAADGAKIGGAASMALEVGQTFRHYFDANNENAEWDDLVWSSPVRDALGAWHDGNGCTAFENVAMETLSAPGLHANARVLARLLELVTSVNPVVLAPVGEGVTA